MVLPAAVDSGSAQQSLGVGVDTFRALRELEVREIGPEDYELLSRLHAKANARTLTAPEVEKLAPAYGLCADQSDACLVCMSAMRKGERARRLPCSGQHIFHAGCIAEWLIHSSRCCPADREDITLS